MANKREPEAITPFQKRKVERDNNLRNEYAKLMEENPARSKMMVRDYLKEKYGICSDDVYYRILRSQANQ